MQLKLYNFINYIFYTLLNQKFAIIYCAFMSRKTSDFIFIICNLQSKGVGGHLLGVGTYLEEYSIYFFSKRDTSLKLLKVHVVKQKKH